MKSLRVIIVLACALFLFISPRAFSKDFKAGVVDIQKVYAAYDKAKQSYVDLQAEKKKKQDEYDKKAAELKKMVDDFNANKDKMKDEQKKEALAKTKDAARELNNFKKQTDDYLLAENQDMTKERMQEIVDAAKAYGADNGFDLVAASNTLIYFAQPLDISDAIIKKLNKK
jgi:outer membrane protein